MIFNRQPRALVDGVHDFLDASVPDDYVENYDRIATDDLAHHLMPDEVKDVLLNCCQLLSPSCDTLVDIGAAYGFVLNGMQAKQKIAVDISIDYLRAIDPSTTRIRCNAEDLPLEDAVADVVVCTDVFEHVLNERALAAELVRILKPGGTLLLACPWEQDLSVYDTPEYIARYRKYKYVHLRSVNDQMIRDAFPAMTLISSTLIRIGEKHMTLKPYPLRFMQMRKS